MKASVRNSECHNEFAVIFVEQNEKGIEKPRLEPCFKGFLHTENVYLDRLYFTGNEKIYKVFSTCFLRVFFTKKRFLHP